MQSLKNTSKSSTILMLGDSLVDYFPIEQLYHGTAKIVNRGVEGLTTFDLITILQCYNLPIIPDKIFLLIGINDFMPEQPDRIEEQIAKRILKIAAMLSEKVPQAQIYIQSLYPIHTSYHPKILFEWLEGKSNEQIQKVNKILAQQCKEKGYIFLNLYPCLLDENSELKIDFTVEGIHINEVAYETVLKNIEPYF